jgi:hypothetical protein
MEVCCSSEKSFTEPIPEWSQERQIQGVIKVLEAIDNLSEEERNLIPDGEEFERLYRPSLRHNEMEDEEW